ncbi:HPr kinase/phosphatase C-terminal domain-containing protein [Porphyrobacter sp. YT40]|uniref:HPr kinase/phosphorylase n=1 Tax=Porphyrobacter sp. YT40 TaxID=2547601 RepID=UPI001142A532|nr:HPr kinase/phosphatase C-terminal domain-containing protein [Porphyrobacter sp. YT40]QDH35510.1 serine kinase [Porphyrobacter sp. YT40]
MNLVYAASAVAIGGRALLIAGAPGSGKSSLALALIDRGAGLIGDDAVKLRREGEALIAAPPPNIGGLLEVRGVGIVTLPVARPAPVALLLDLSATPAERLPPDPLPTRVFEGVAVPVLAFDPGPAAPALRAEWALRLHGIGHEAASLASGLGPADTPQQRP